MNGHGSVAAPPTAVLRQASAPRRWTTKGLAAAVIFVVLGGLVLMYAVPAYSKRVTVLVVARAVPIGARISDADLATARITSDPALTPVAATDRGAIVGRFATVTLRPGTLLTLSEVGDSDGFTAGQVLVPLALRAGQLPARGIVPGEQVLIVATPTNVTGSTAGSTTPSSDPSQSQGTRATVAETGPANTATGVTVVDVSVPSADGVALAKLAATGNLTVVLLPAGG
jgi:hypothetical protein